MTASLFLQRLGIVEGFYGPSWSMTHHNRLIEFGAARGINTYLYPPKNDPYHRKLSARVPKKQWHELLRLLRAAPRQRIDFAYGHHPSEGLHFDDERAVHILLRKGQRFYDVGVRTFAALFDDIPPRLSKPRDRRGDACARRCRQYRSIFRPQARPGQRH